MKRFFYLGSVAMLISLAACNTNSDNNTTVASDTMATTTVTTDTSMAVVTSPNAGSSVVVREGELPAPVQEAFVLKYPKVTATEWQVYTPGSADEDLELGTPYYYTKVNENGNDYWIWYDERGMWVKNVQPMPKDSRLPDAVNKTINEQYPGYVIEEISKELSLIHI